MIGGLPGPRHDGETRDRAGRRGQAFSVDSDGHGRPARHAFGVDPANGLILDTEEMLTTSAGKPDVRIPAVISYQIYLRAEFQGSTGMRGGARARAQAVAVAGGRGP